MELGLIILIVFLIIAIVLVVFVAINNTVWQPGLISAFPIQMNASSFLNPAQSSSSNTTSLNGSFIATFSGPLFAFSPQSISINYSKNIATHVVTLYVPTLFTGAGTVTSAQVITASGAIPSLLLPVSNSSPAPLQNPFPIQNIIGGVIDVTTSVQNTCNTLSGTVAATTAGDLVVTIDEVQPLFPHNNGQFPAVCSIGFGAFQFSYQGNP